MAEENTQEKIDKAELENPELEASEKAVEEDVEATPEDVEEELEKEVEETEKVKSVSERRREEREEKKREEFLSWAPKTKLGKEVKEGKIKDIDEILDSGRTIMEDKVVDTLVNIKSDLISAGQSKGKFGGGKRRAWRQTQKKTKEGNVPSFSAFAVVGDENGHVGIGSGKAKETLPARDKAIRKAKLNMIKIGRACGGFDCSCVEQHSIPFEVTGKSGSVTVRLIPAPQGTGLVAANELKKILQLAGIKDVYSKTFGKRRTAFNLVKACMQALEKTNPKNTEANK